MSTRQAIILSLGMAAASAIFGILFIQARTPERTVQVVGFATRQFGTDMVKMKLNILRRSQGNDVGRAYEALRENMTLIQRRLEAIGIDGGDITVSPPASMEIYNRDGIADQYNIAQDIYVVTDKVQEVEKLVLAPAEFLAKGNLLRNSQLEYFYSGVEELKYELLSAASADARRRAESIAAASGLNVGAIRQARSGVFQITEPYSTEVQSYGVYNTASPDKQIRVTVHVTFELE